MLRRLEVGLIDEGCRVVRMTPSGAAQEPTTGLAFHVEYNDDRWGRWIDSPRRRFLRAAGEGALASEGEDARVDVVHVFGCDAWEASLRMAQEFGADLALEVCSRRCLTLARSFERRAASRGVDGIWLSPDQSMADAVSGAVSLWPVRVAAWGVHAGAPASMRAEPVRGVCIMSPGNDSMALPALFEGAARALVDRPEIMLFLDASALEHHPRCWRHARDAGLSARLSIVPEMESRRELVLQTDALVRPARDGEHASLMLQALASGMALVACADRLVGVTCDRSIAIVVEESTREGWERAWRALVDPQGPARSLGFAASRYIAEHRPAHAQVRAALEAYDALARAAGRPLPLSTPD